MSLGQIAILTKRNRDLGEKREGIEGSRFDVDTLKIEESERVIWCSVI